MHKQWGLCHTQYKQTWSDVQTCTNSGVCVTQCKQTWSDMHKQWGLCHTQYKQTWSDGHAQTVGYASHSTNRPGQTCTNSGVCVTQCKQTWTDRQTCTNSGVCFTQCKQTWSISLYYLHFMLSFAPLCVKRVRIYIAELYVPIRVTVLSLKLPPLR